MEPQQATPTVPPQPVEQSPSLPTVGHLKSFLLAVLILLLGAVITYAYQNYQPQPQSDLLPHPEDIPSPTLDETLEWKTYTSEIFSFKYPQHLLLEEREKNYIVLLTDPNNSQSVFVSIDARLEGAYANYENAVEKTKEGLTNVVIQEMNNRVKISGIVGPGYGEGIPITQAFFKYKEGTIEAETTTKDSTQLQLFDQILSSFRFVEEENLSPTTIQSNKPKKLSVEEIQYTLPANWFRDYHTTENTLLLVRNEGGFLAIQVYSYPSGIDMKDYYCQLTDVCIPETYFTSRTIGNISGHSANALDNSGGGTEYFGTKGNKFYHISSYGGAGGDFDEMLSSLVF